VQVRVRRGRALALASLALAVTLVAGACSDSGSTDGDGPGPTSEPTTTKEPKPRALSFGVYGTEGEINAYRRVAGSFNGATDQSDVSVRPYATVDDLAAAVEAGDVPDVYLVSRDDLAAFSAAGAIQPLTDLLDDRGVDIGDAYSRDALEAFSFDRELQCMPYETSPDVVFYNKRWVDFDRIRARGLPVPNITPEDPENPDVPPPAPRWSFEMFAAAANVATRPRRDVRGMYVEPTLRGLAPFIYSGGGQVFDDDADPTSLALADDGTRDALETVLPVLRDPELTLTDDQLARATPLEWFERGRLAMMVGSHALVRELRDVEGLDFDVLPMPIVDEDATVGDITGICLSGSTRKTSEAADFLVHAISADSVRQVVEAGYLSPANQTVALSDSFLEPGLLPIHSSVFAATARSMVIPPLLRDPEALDAAVGPLVASLLQTPVLDLDQVTTQIDEVSQGVLAPEDPDDGGGDSEAPEEPSEQDAG
jgi:multiple sugar transport system substrate-binding protein